jgi:hypothetical protein
MVGTEGDVGPPKVPPRQRIVVKKFKTNRKRGAAAARTRNANGIKKSMKSLNASSDKNRIPKPTRNNPPTRESFGLPTFRFAATNPSNSVRKYTGGTNGDGNDASHEVQNEFFPNEDEPEDEIPSDSLVAIHSLIQSDQGLHVPITNNGSVQVILESQVYSIFDENHASNVNAELMELIRANKVQRMYCHDVSTIAFMMTEDYVKAVWDSYNHQDAIIPRDASAMGKTDTPNEEIVSWFLAQLHLWTNLSITETSLEDQWEIHNDKRTGDDAAAAAATMKTRDAVRYLLNAQFLIRDPKNALSGGGNRNDSYFLWLPNWGIVLKTWNEARQQLLNLLAQRKEMSKANVLQKNRHSKISTSFLLNELLSKEKIRVVERPFGSFIQPVRDP